MEIADIIIVLYGVIHSVFCLAVWNQEASA
jgi:hypothetical protein